jgi:ferritin-like metal-binding protein YciE
MDDLIIIQLENLYDAELRIAGAWAGIAEATGNPTLIAAFHEHWCAALKHGEMLAEFLKTMEVNSHRKNCDAIQHLIAQAKEMLATTTTPHLKIAALIVVARRVHHYKIAAYASIRNLVQQSGRRDLVARLHQALETEIEAEKLLTRLASSIVRSENAGSPA